MNGGTRIPRAIDKFTADERREIADQLGHLAMFFTTATAEARRERDHWKERALAAEAIVARHRAGVLDTDVAAWT